MSRNPAAAALLLARAERELITVALDLRTASQLFPERRAELDALAAQASALGLAVAGARWRVTEPAAAAPPRPELVRVHSESVAVERWPAHPSSGHCQACGCLALLSHGGLCPRCLMHDDTDAPAGGQS